VYQPDGSFSWLYSENITVMENGFTKTFKIPYSEKTGKWPVTVKDVATGVFGEVEFEVI